MNIMLDIIFLTKNRLEFTKASLNALLRNTDWNLVRKLMVFDDGSKDKTSEFLIQHLTLSEKFHVDTTLVLDKRYGGPAAVTMDYVNSRDPAPMFVKIDNDVIVPPGWLNRVAATMDANPSLDLLGIEPPFSRTPSRADGPRSPQPEFDSAFAGQDYAPCNSIGGIGAMRLAPFVKYGGKLVQHSIYGGFTEWQLAHRDIAKGWINPPLDLFLLDRLPIEPWTSLSARYIREGNQRAWSRYPMSNPFWKWWEATS